MSHSHVPNADLHSREVETHCRFTGAHGLMHPQMLADKSVECFLPLLYSVRPLYVDGLFASLLSPPPKTGSARACMGCGTFASIFRLFPTGFTDDY